MSQHKGPPELCLDCARDRARAERAYGGHASIRELTAAARAVVDGPRDPWVAINALAALLEEADPDVADTAWAIIEHHHRHRTAG